ncbi:MAG: hypothetical protein LQ350_000671 [Teloschistes chrysophthalmus]|nr:MAG: hypothetical protein LQ350_000671 [Niorma chrysophthalma]
MALHRPPLTLPASTHQFFKFAASSISRNAASSQNPQYIHSSTHFRPTTSRRKLVTTTSYRPHSFESIPPSPNFPAPPRNTGVPDSSIAGTKKPQVHDTRPPPTDISTQQKTLQPSHQDDHPSLSLPESEAQKTSPVTPPQPTPTPPRKSRLRPRKAAISLTSPAIHQLRRLLSAPTPQLIRVGVRNRGCSGLAYHLEYVEKPNAMDESVEQDGVKVLVDSKALFSVLGSEMDWVEDKLSARFVFRNPNISEFLSSSLILSFLSVLFHLGVVLVGADF